MSHFNDFIGRILAHEGGYVNDPRDPGGETNWGISKRSYPRVDIKNLSRKEAVEIYRRDFWNKLQCDKLPPAVAFQLMDAAINHGHKNAVRWLQRAINVNEDGIVGPVTLFYANRLPPALLALAFNSARLDFYASLKTFHTYARGWSRRVAVNLLHAVVDIAATSGEKKG